MITPQRILTAAFALLITLGLRAELVTYPAGEGVETLSDFSVKVRQGNGAWQSVAVYPVKVDEVRGTS
ncbi:MAG: hypothetical protein K2M76_06425, partial [Muribaculaceae bacterium]|nr:hypothetical protein [Muribaculaceae bacterium]